jgi:hypothetical protein
LGLSERLRFARSKGRRNPRNRRSRPSEKSWVRVGYREERRHGVERRKHRFASPRPARSRRRRRRRRREASADVLYDSGITSQTAQLTNSSPSAWIGPELPAGLRKKCCCLLQKKMSLSSFGSHNLRLQAVAVLIRRLVSLKGFEYHQPSHLVVINHYQICSTR